MVPPKRTVFRDIMPSCSNPLRLSLRKQNARTESAQYEPTVTLAPLPSDSQLIIEQIEHRRWSTLADDMTADKLRSLDSQATNDTDRAPVLHHVLHYDPPLTIVSKVTQVLPESLVRRDSLGRTPLHVAVEKGASHFIVSHLIKSLPQACNVKDHEGKTPLHRCFDGQYQCFQRDRRGELTKYELEKGSTIVEALVDASPSSLDIEDDSGMCSLELAILSEAPIHIVKLLQRVKRCHRHLESLLKPCTERPNDHTTELENNPRRNSLTSPSA